MITYHRGLIQGSDEWLAARCGILTASEMKLIITPTLNPAKNDKERSHLYHLLAQRITGYVEPHYISDDMIRGQEDEIEARLQYAEHDAPVEEMGFIVNDDHGFPIGFSPDGLVGDDGFIECKSRCQKYQMETLITGEMPSDYLMQVQTGFIVTGRKWCDFISYCGGLPRVAIRVFPNPEIMQAIITAATDFECRLQEKLNAYAEILKSNPRLIPTKRRIIQELF